MSSTFHLDVVSPEGQIFAGDAKALHVRGAGGELGIMPGHLQLLTRLPAGAARIETETGDERVLFVSGGILEVQPDHVTIMADTVERPEDVNESAAKKAKAAAEEALKGKKQGTVDYQQAQQDLAEALAKLRVLELMRLRKKRH